MTQPTETLERRERLIARLLWNGTWLASSIIAAGLILDFLHRIDVALFPNLAGSQVAAAGIALFILLPIARVVLMLAIFLHERDYAYTAISALVLVIIGIGFAIGL
ncbi:hypothetical protein CR159_10855 [Pollutimonas subterranea]|uniref:DUF1634 domain-containing protein n=1 Tax=Pollutimonas subterranea TaxID=2045210 RepID=A0A2N4U434_9BURK|nr:DUF1634 domain-containing protein [Pollutimonas subterranea]PLC49785.1 hypothetical protein CR159_10855 [Pollutimonas subterranea]